MITKLFPRAHLSNLVIPEPIHYSCHSAYDPLSPSLTAALHLPQGTVSKVLFVSIYLVRTSVILKLEAEESFLPKGALYQWKILRLPASG